MATHRYRRIEIGESVIPDEAISLIEDIQTLNQILALLGTIRDRNVTAPARDHAAANSEAIKTLRRVGFLISAMHSIASDNFRCDHLAGKPMKRDVHRQTLADVWQVLLECKENI